MNFIDTHCHLNIEPLLDRTNEILDAAAEQGIQNMVVVGIDLPTSEIAIRLAEDHEQIYASAGIHPNDCVKAPERWEQEVLDMLAHPKVVAVGETGLDYY